MWQIYIDFCPTAFAAAEKDELVKVALISETNIVTKQGKKIWIGLHQIIQSGWHTYWRYAGDSGLPTRLSWKTNNDLDIGQINWPLPQVIKVGSLISYGYENETVLLVPLNVKNSETIDLTVEAEWLVCKEICIPQRKVLSLKLPQKTDEISSTSSSLIKYFRNKVPLEMAWKTEVIIKGKQIRLKIFMSKDEIKKIDEIRMFPSIDGLIDNNGVQRFSKNTDNIVLDMKAGYAIKEGLKYFEGVIRIAKIENGKSSYLGYRINHMPISFE